MFDAMNLRPTDDRDPPVFHKVNASGRSRALLVCDHASNALPRGYDCLGIAPEKMFEHIAWDVGAAAVTRELATLLDAPAIMAGFSRLFADPNRFPDDPTVIATHSDGTHVTGNESISEHERRKRLDWHAAYHNEIAQMIAGFDGGPPPLIVFIHSFTPRIGGVQRPWHLGVLHDGNSSESHALLAELRRDDAFVTGDNQPYSVDQPKSHSIYRHGIDAQRPYIALEIRQDLIESVDTAERWADTIAQALQKALSSQGFFQQA